MPLGTEIGTGQRDFVLDEDPALPPEKRRGLAPQFSAHVYSDQTAGRTKMPLGTDVDLAQGDIVLDGDTAPSSPQKGHNPQFSAHVYSGKTAEWIKMLLGTEVGLGSGDIVLDGTQLHPPKKGTALNFALMSVVAKRLDGSRCHLIRR